MVTLVSRLEREYFGSNKKGFIHYPEFVGDAFHQEERESKVGIGISTYEAADELLEALCTIQVSRSSRNDALHRMLKKKNGYKCQVCGAYRPGKGELEVHHRDSVWDDSESNLIVCCWSCHSEHARAIT